MKKQTKNKTWRKVKLGNYVRPIRGVSYSSSDLRKSENSIYFVNLKNIDRGGGFRQGGLKTYSGKYKKKQLVSVGDIVIAMTDLTPQAEVIGMPALIAKFDKKVCISMDIVKLEFKKEGIDKKFLYYLLNHRNYKGWIKGFATGVNVLHLNSGGITEYEFEMPKKLSEQKKIASILSAFDDKIELNNKINQNLEQMAQAIFKEWFVKFRFPGYEKVKFVDSELRKIPEEWEVKKLGKIVKIEYGKGPSTKDLKKNGYPVYGANGIIGYLEKYKFDKSQIIVGCRGVVGSLFKTLPKSSITHNSLIINHTNFSEKNYLFMLLKNSNLQSVVGGSAQPQITIKELSQLPVLFAKQNVRERFEKIVENFEEKRLNIIYENQKLASLRDLLLPKLMSGEIRL